MPIPPPHHQRKQSWAFCAVWDRDVWFQSHPCRFISFPSLSASTSQRGENPAQGHALVSSGSWLLVAGSSLLCTWKGLHEPACLCPCPGLKHFTLAISRRSLPCTYSSWSLELAWLFLLPKTLFSLYLAFLSVSKKNPVSSEPTHSHAQLKVLSPRGLLPGLFRPQGLVEAPHTPI